MTRTLWLRTPWFHGNLRPVHVGWYERIYNETWISKYYWDGTRWLLYPDQDPSNYQFLKWRGLTEPHGESNGS